MKKLLIIFLISFCAILPLSAQQRGGSNESGIVEIVDASGKVVGQFKGAYALVIGESEYTNGWRRLPGVKEDIVAVKKLFLEQGFNVETIENADSHNLKNGIINFLDNYAYEKDNRIIVYYAGHGETIDRTIGGRMGYIVPIDAPPSRDSKEFLQTVIPMEQFQTWAQQYSSRHILFMFDSCFAGSVFRSGNSKPPAINRLINEPVRQFITSGDADESVPDESIFRRELEHAIRNGAGDLNNDGYITGTELGLYLYDKVSNYMNGKQNPRMGKLNNSKLDKGDFVFFVNDPQSPISKGEQITSIIPQNNAVQPSVSANTTIVNTPSKTQDKPGEPGYFVGTWKATVPYNNSFDTYEITMTADGRCTVKITNDYAEQETTGNWSFDKKENVFKLNNVVFRNPKIEYRRNINWVCRVKFSENIDSFNINAKPADNAPNIIGFTFSRN